ncbi:hypothetical protein J6TS1_13710 [Siminovitchia terrae]|uniref:Uncharacterized protein n=1 Tax=Siminovitchia terrae TaxID=1914933 RepID=A0ABQ4KV67_SIMTE|nr:hypothetical protein J22TS1_18170 [Siminovitchia terrae]GIN95501.1 hypothetical protein J6TS1_13710 [Siminovitchia terrae]
MGTRSEIVKVIIRMAVKNKSLPRAKKNPSFLMIPYASFIALTIDWTAMEEIQKEEIKLNEASLVLCLSKMRMILFSISA